MEVQKTTDYYPSSQTFYTSVTPVMGTRLEVLIIGKEEKEARKIGTELERETRRLEGVLSRFTPQSELFRLNSRAAQSPTLVSDELWKILKNCQRYYQLTLHLFDISRSDLSRVEFNDADKTIYYQLPDISLDLGGYGKGYALARINKILLNHHVDAALVNFGNSSVLAIGNHPYGDYWPVGITHPATGENIGNIRLKNNSLSTSGNTPSHPRHIYNPLTATYYMGEEIISVVSPDPIEAEVLSTALLMADKEQEKAIIPHFLIEDIIRSKI